MTHVLCRVLGSALVLILVLGLAPAHAQAQSPTLVAPPRSISDISANLEREKPDPEKRAKVLAEADAQITPGPGAAEQLARRARARAAAGRGREAVTDMEQAIGLAKASKADYQNVISRYEIVLIRLLRSTGNTKRAIALTESQIKTFQNSAKGRLFNLYLQMTVMLVGQGDINRAETYAKRASALQAESRDWRNPAFEAYRTFWAADVHDANARVYDARGRYAEAERSYRLAGESAADAQRQSARWQQRPPRESFDPAIDWALAHEGRAKARQGRLTEGEADIRRALIARLSRVGKYHSDTAGILSILSWVLAEQGRHQESETIARELEGIVRQLGAPDDSRSVVNAQLLLANSLNMQRRYEEAAEVYRRVDKAVENWEPAHRDAAMNSATRVNALLFSGKTSDEDAVAMARNYYERTKGRAGENTMTTAVARGYVALALARTGKLAEALVEFRATIPVLLDASRAADDEDGATAVAREARQRVIVESYLTLLARNPALAGSDIGEETFRLADIVRGQSVERALSASSARAAAKSPGLAELVRHQQDLGKQIAATVGNLNNMLGALPEERDPAAIKTAQGTLAKLKAEHVTASRNIAKRFPEYAELVEPPPVTSAEIRQHLRPDEAFLSFYFGRFNSFVWAVPKQGPIRFARLALNGRDLDAAVSKLREALEPQATMISEIPAFDLALAHDLYAKLLAPVAEGWKPAKSLIVVTNGALGLLPLSLLPTAAASIDQNREPAFSAYRDVPWLARTHAVTVVPSANALRTLRRLPATSAKRDLMIGFGDPIFSKEQAAEAAKAVSEAPVATADLGTRGLPLRRRASPQLDGVASASLALLPRLPDTADELRSIALALQADPSKALNLGTQANEQLVKSADLSKYKILVFATHGLVPGELDGLTQPALALSAPDVAGGAGDGLLTMEEILSLKLNADWVVLSACNTGAGSGAGAEAASGLGRAFFYAGTRALLVTNWAVHSQSARDLTSDLFRRQSEDPKLSRAEAMRQAMLALMDGEGFKDESGATLFSYAHPLFWAPFTLIGDGG